MKILITGASGMLGKDLCPVLEDEGHQIIETDVETLDITDISQIKKEFTTHNPDFVIHCAAYTNVDKAEEEEFKAKLINTKGTENIAKICAENDIPLFYISTDYVFDGESQKPYTPQDKPNPINVYGKTKLYGEKAVTKFCEKYYIARTSWLYGHHGKNFVETMLSLANKDEIKVVDDQIGCPTWTVDLANAIAEIIDDGYEYGVYHLCGKGQTSWYGFAKEIFKLAKIEANVIPCETKDFPRPAKRPENSAMDNEDFCRKWESALKDYIELRGEL